MVVMKTHKHTSPLCTVQTAN